MKRLTLPLLALLLAAAPRAHAQEKASVSGFITDATSGETLLLANIVIAGTTLGTATNTAGYYTLTGLSPGDYTLIASYIGYQNREVVVTLAAGEARRLDVELLPEGIQIDEVVVTAERETEEEIRRVGVAQLSTEQIRQLPTVLEPDVFRSLQLLPGVKAASDFSSGLYIRGGSPDQTLILLDRTTVYNPSHFFGFFSTFNPDAIKDVRLYKGGYPAEYGGRIGSVVDIYNKDGNRRITTGRASLGLLASRVLVEGPYSKGSWMFAARRSTLEPLLAAFRAQDIDGIPESFYFYDLNGKFNFDANENNRFSLSFYAGQDALELPPIDDVFIDLTYGNRTVSGNWTHLFSEQLFSNFTGTLSRYESKPNFNVAGTKFEQRNNVYDASLKGDFEYIPNERHAFSVGFWTGNFVLRYRESFDGNERIASRIQTIYGALYAQQRYQPSPLWTIQGGVRLNYFDQGNYLRFEPRLSLEHQPRAGVRLQAGYGRYYQFLTLITSEVFSGFDTWLTTDTGVPPAYGDQFVGGVKLNLRENTNLDIEGYFRTMRDLFELDPRLPDAAGLDYDQLFRFGEGFAYGVEVLLQQTRGRLNGFVGYTFGITRRRFPDYPEIGQFDYYAPKYDRRHDVNLVLNYNFSRKWRATTVFSFASGQAYTKPASQYKFLDNPFGSDSKEAFVSPYNEARLPNYHRLDVGFSRLGTFFGIGEYELQLQVINVYARKNVWFNIFDFEDDNTVSREEQLMIPIPIPNIAFTVTF